MKPHFFINLLMYTGVFLSVSCSPKEKNESTDLKTICNPINLSYRFTIDPIGCEGESYREAADPSVVLFKDTYYMFLSKSGGYFRSTDLIEWELILTQDLPLENYAPTAVVIDEEIYFMTSGHDKIYKTASPETGKWEIAKDEFPYTYTDPMLFLDEDQRLYYYGGCSDTDPLVGIELDKNTLNPIGGLKELISSRKEIYGWEVAGDYNTRTDDLPWLEGVWVNKYKGKYYLQYSGPGTEFKSYNDGVYVSENPLGPFEPATHNPFAYKPEGFATGAGHGSTFIDKYGNYWHFGTISISVRHMFERRLSLYPAFFDEDGVLWSYTGFGDYPMIIPQKKISNPEELSPEWMLLSYNKPVEVSSSWGGFTAENAVDEEIRTWWSAATGKKGEYLSVDLGDLQDIYAIQINFSDQNAFLSGRKDSMYYRYFIEFSTDGERWEKVIDRSQSLLDLPHDYIQLSLPQKARYVKITNVEIPAGFFSLSGFRIFGKSDIEIPGKVDTFQLERDTDKRIARLKWEKVPDAIGYNIRFGTKKDKLYHNYMVYDANELTIRSLNANESYYFVIDSFNEGGICKGTFIQEIK